MKQWKQPVAGSSRVCAPMTVDGGQVLQGTAGGLGQREQARSRTDGSVFWSTALPTFNLGWRLQELEERPVPPHRHVDGEQQRV